MIAGSVTQFITQTYQAPYRPADQSGLAARDRVLNDSAHPYNDFIWALARNFTNSPEEAEAAVREMQTDIQRCAEKGAGVQPDQDGVIARIAWRRLLNFLQ